MQYRKDETTVRAQQPVRRLQHAAQVRFQDLSSSIAVDIANTQRVKHLSFAGDLQETVGQVQANHLGPKAR